MARKQVIVQLDDGLLQRLDAEASDAHTSRSEVIRKAIDAWFEAKRIARLDFEYAEGYRRFPEDAALGESLMRLAAENAPPYDA